MSSWVPSTSTSVTGRPSFGQSTPRHLWQTNSGSATNLPVRPLHFLWTHSLHWLHSIEVTPTPLWQMAHGNSPESYRRLSPTLEIRNFVFFILTLKPLLSIPAFQTSSLEMHSSRKSAITTRSSAYRSSQGTPVRNSRNNASSTRMTG